MISLSTEFQLCLKSQRHWRDDSQVVFIRMILYIVAVLDFFFFFLMFVGKQKYELFASQWYLMLQCWVLGSRYSFSVFTPEYSFDGFRN